MTGDVCLASFDGNFFLDSIVVACKSNGQRGKKGVMPFSSSNLLAREYDKEISPQPDPRRMARVEMSNMCPGLAGALPQPWRTPRSQVQECTCARTSKYFWRERLVRTRTEDGIWRGGRGDGGWGDPESPWQRVHLQRAVSLRGMGEKDRNSWSCAPVKRTG